MFLVFMGCKKFEPEVYDNVTKVTDYDGNVYQTVQIGEQIWMKENLKVTHYSDGTPISFADNMDEWEWADGATYCWYDFNPSYGSVYGALYNWSAATRYNNQSNAIPSGVQGVCPEGWHLPSDTEWMELESFLGMDKEHLNLTFPDRRGNNEGGKMKEEGNIHWKDTNLGATNESGFTALPGGYNGGSYFAFVDSVACFWSSTESYLDGFVMVRWLVDIYADIWRTHEYVGGGLSVRCLKD